MNPPEWTAVDRFFTDALHPADPALDAALTTSAAAQLPAINVTANQGKFLHLLARIRGARRILEIGTLGGYSTIWLARALPADGKLVTLELNPDYAAIARGNFQRAGVADKIELRLGRAADSLAQLIAEKAAPFDLVFIDADKASTAEYFTAALKLVRAGSVIVVDNVVRGGRVADATSTDADIQGIRRFFALAQSERRVDGTALQTVGSKSYDGFALLLVL